VEHKSQEVVTLYLMVKKSHEAVIKWLLIIRN
jgi:hypothetical protein